MQGRIQELARGGAQASLSCRGIGNKIYIFDRGLQSFTKA